jgi:hypothetical protein
VKILHAQSAATANTGVLHLVCIRFTVLFDLGPIYLTHPAHGYIFA